MIPKRQLYLRTNVCTNQCTYPINVRTNQCSMYQSMYAPINVCTNQCMYQSMYVPINVCTNQCMYQSMYVPINVCTNQCMYQSMYVCVFSSHPFWTSSSLDVPAGVTQEEGHTGFLIHLPSAVRALIFVARRIQPFLSLVDREVEFCVLTN